MKDELVSFELAKLAKEIGFDFSCKYYYYQSYAEDHKEDVKSKLSDFHQLEVNFNDSKGNLRKYSAPTQSLLQRWFREEYGILVIPNFDTYGTKTYYYSIVKDGMNINYEIKSNSWEKALEAGLLEVLKSVEQLKIKHL